MLFKIDKVIVKKKNGKKLKYKKVIFLARDSEKSCFVIKHVLDEGKEIDRTENVVFKDKEIKYIKNF